MYPVIVMLVYLLSITRLMDIILYPDKLPPTCIAFEASSTRTDGTSVAAIFITGHHYNDRTVVESNLTISNAVVVGKKKCWDRNEKKDVNIFMDEYIRREYFSNNYGSTSTFQLVNGLGTPKNINVTDVINIQLCHSDNNDSSVCLASFTVLFTLSIAPLPQYVITPAGVSASSLCSSLTWS